MTSEPLDPSSRTFPAEPSGDDLQKKSWRTNPWLVFLGPFVLFMLMGAIEPSAPPSPVVAAEGEAESKPWLDLRLEYRHYPIIYSLKILLVTLAVAAVRPGYPRMQRISPLAPMVGVMGVAAWVALAHGQRWLEIASGLGPTIESWLGGRRAGFNPLEQLENQPAMAWGFLFVRFFGLAAVVPVIEELFLRGFVGRFPAANDWWRVPIGQFDRVGLIAVIALPVLIHPHEALAAVVWFGAVAWLLLRTKNVWDCVVAHAITNLLLGIYVVVTGEWWLM